MMSVTIDPSETRSAPQAPAPARRTMLPVVGRLVLGFLGCVGLAGFSVGAYSMMGQFARPQVAKVAIGRQAAEWPDLKDGIPAMVPAIAPSRAEPARPPSQSTDAKPGSVAAGLALPTPVVASALPSTVASPPRNAAAPPPRPLPPIETATVVRPVRLAPLAPPAAMAALVPPSPAQTVRARSAEVRFAALPPEPAAQPAAKPVRKPPVTSARAKPVPGPVATPAPAAAPPAAEAEETEMFGMKVPTLAASGRRLVDGVKSLGDAVAKQF